MPFGIWLILLIMVSSKFNDDYQKPECRGEGREIEKKEKEKVKWCLPGTGRVERGVMSNGLMDTEFPFWKMNKSSGYGWWWWLHILLMNSTLKIVESVSFILCVFYTTNKDMMANVLETKTQKHSTLQIPYLLVFTISMKTRCALKVHLSFGWLKHENSNQMTGLNGSTRLRNWGGVGSKQWGKGTRLSENFKATGSQNRKREKLFVVRFVLSDWLVCATSYWINSTHPLIIQPGKSKYARFMSLQNAPCSNSH